MKQLSTPLVSVIVPFYNVEKYVNDCLSSLRNQTLRQIEIICVDDGSSDRTGALLDEYAACDQRIKVIHQENSGAACARNVGLEQAAGTYLSFLDSDDFFEPTMLEAAYCKAAIYDLDVVIYGSNQYIQRDSAYKTTPWAVKLAQIPDSECFRLEDVRSNRFRAFQGWAWDKLFKTELIKSSGLKFQEQRIYNDMFFVYAACISANRIAFIDRALAHQRKRGGGSLSDNSSPYWECLLTALDKLGDFICQTGQPADIVEDFSGYINTMVQRQLSLCSKKDQKAMLSGLGEWQKKLPPAYSLRLDELLE